MKKNKFFNYRTFIGLLISIIGLYLGFKDFQVEEFFKALNNANLLLFFVSMAVMIFVVFLRAWRWQTILDPLKNISLHRMFEAEMIGYFGNNVFPLRLGELLRSYSLGKSEQISAATVFGTVVVERVMDAIFTVFVMFFAVLTFDNMPAWIHKSAIAGIITFSVFLLGLIILVINKEKLEDIDWLNKYSDTKIFQILAKFVRGLIMLKENPHTLKIIIQSLLVGGVNIFFYWVIGVVFGIQFSFASVLLIYFVTMAIIAVPSSPGYVGTYHAGAIYILQFIGHPEPRAQAIAVIMHAAGFIPLVLIGGVYFVKSQININEFDEKQVEKNE